MNEWLAYIPTLGIEVEHVARSLLYIGTYLGR